MSDVTDRSLGLVVLVQMSLSARDRRRCVPLGVLAVPAGIGLLAEGRGHGWLPWWASLLVLVTAAVLSAATVHYVSDGDVFTWGLVEVSIGLAAEMPHDRWVLGPLAVGIAAGFGYKMSRQPVRACLNAAMYIAAAAAGLAAAHAGVDQGGLVAAGAAAAIASVATSCVVYVLSTWVMAHVNERALREVAVRYLKPDVFHATVVAVLATALGVLAHADLRAAAAAVFVAALLLPLSAARLQAKAEASELRATLDGLAELIRTTDPAAAEEGLLRLARRLTGIGGIDLSGRAHQSGHAEPTLSDAADSSIFVMSAGRPEVGRRLLHQPPERVLDRLAAVGGAALDASRRGHAWRALAELDPLTGLLNRRAFTGALHQHFARPGGALPCTVVFMDLDGFKAVNDQFGHDAGDLLLREVAIELLRSTRRGDVCARLGGDEFCMLLTDDASQLGSEAVRARISEAVQQAGRSAAFTVSASIGLATFPADALTGPELLTVADRRMYEDKHARRSGADETVGYTVTIRSD